MPGQLAEVGRVVNRVLWVHRPVTDVLVLAGTGAVVAVLLRAERVHAELPPVTLDLLTLGAAGVGAGAAILAAVAAHLLDDLRPAWIAAALVLYCAVVLPWSTVLATQPGGTQRAPLLITYLTAVALLVLAVRPPPVLGRWGAWVICAAGGVLGALVPNLPGATGLSAFFEGPAPTVVALIGWTAAADRDHELRNGLAGLAGITHLLGTDPEDDERRALKHAVLTELGRLLTLVDDGISGAGGADGADGAGGAGGAAAASPEAGYPVEQVLSDRVALREATCGPEAGPLDLRVEPGLRAAGDPDLLAQVLTNVLANCERHAYGAPISVTATAEGDLVRVEVRDEGPGLPPGVAETVLERGVRDESAGGSGIGLHICAGLLARAGGEFAVKSCDAPSGCLVALTLPRVTEVTSSQPVIAGGRPSSVTMGTADNR